MSREAPRPLDSAEFDGLFDGFRRSVVRVEAKQAYAVGGAEADRIAAWRTGRPRPERSVRTSPWLARIAATTVADGKRWQRLRVLSSPPTEYQRYQLNGYVESQACGDEVLVTDLARVVERNLPDVWLFDEGLTSAHAVEMRYDDDGKLVERLLRRDAEFVAAALVLVRELRQVVQPLNEYLAG